MCAEVGSEGMNINLNTFCSFPYQQALEPFHLKYFISMKAIFSSNCLTRMHIHTVQREMIDEYFISDLSKSAIFFFFKCSDAVNHVT